MKAVDVQHGDAIIAALDRAPLTRRHLLFLGALLGALVFDYAKPFTISFVIPGMRQMWGLSAVSASYLPIAGLSGTMVGSVVWGFAAGRIGRRATLLMVIEDCVSACGVWTSDVLVGPHHLLPTLPYPDHASAFPYSTSLRRCTCWR